VSAGADSGDDLKLLGKAARDFASARSPLSRARRGETSRNLWREMGRLGWLGLLVPEADGGSGMGARFGAEVLKELGRVLAPEPLVPVAWLAATVLSGRSDDLSALASGERLFAVAYLEPGSRFGMEQTPERVATRFQGGALSGEKRQVLGAGEADTLLVSARGDDGQVALYAVARDAAGVSLEPQQLLDLRDAQVVKLAGAKAERVAGTDALARAFDVATIGLSAEMLGSMQAAFDMTVEYLRTRVQFNVPIGSFQALQHRAARLYVEIELARSAVESATEALDGDEGKNARALARVASVAKAKCSEAFLAVALEAVQMHGGIGMTDEHDIGLFLKRARVAEMTFGDAAYHRDRFARLAGW
jgi:alkylation response protein AidB-like acyl-CoA dehydrogenase